MQRLRGTKKRKTSKSKTRKRSTRKGQRRKTVSKRRAYVNTPSDLKNQVTAILKLIRMIKTETLASANMKTKADSLLLDLRYQLDEM